MPDDNDYFDMPLAQRRAYDALRYKPREGGNKKPDRRLSPDFIDEESFDDTDT